MSFNNILKSLLLVFFAFNGFSHFLFVCSFSISCMIFLLVIKLLVHHTTCINLTIKTFSTFVQLDFMAYVYICPASILVTYTNTYTENRTHSQTITVPNPIYHFPFFCYFSLFQLFSHKINRNKQFQLSLFTDHLILRTPNIECLT